MKLSRFFVGAAAFAAAGLISTSALAQDHGKPADKPKEAQPATPAPAKPAEPTKPDTKAPDAKTPPTATPTTEEKLVYVKLSTSKGDIVLELNNEKAPISTKNFMSYVDKKFYDGTIFHRVINNFMIQGGGFTEDLKQKPTDSPIKNEWKNGLKNERGAVSMARTNVADSATSQFFINVKANDFLDKPNDGAAYAVFGKVVAGMDVVDKIKVVKTGNKGGMGDVPVETVKINSATKISADDAKKLMTSGGGETKKEEPAKK